MNDFGLSQKNLDFLKETIQKFIAKDDLKSVWIFGSRATGKQRPFSDIDILIELPSGNSVALSAMAEAFEESYFPYKVDLVNLKNLAATYAPQIHKEKLRLFDDQ